MGVLMGGGYNQSRPKRRRTAERARRCRAPGRRRPPPLLRPRRSPTAFQRATTPDTPPRRAGPPPGSGSCHRHPAKFWGSPACTGGARRTSDATRASPPLAPSPPPPPRAPSPPPPSLAPWTRGGARRRAPKCFARWPSRRRGLQGAKVGHPRARAPVALARRPPPPLAIPAAVAGVAGEGRAPAPPRLTLRPLAGAAPGGGAAVRLGQHSCASAFGRR